jgi:two-component system OmpR family sensor kinase
VAEAAGCTVRVRSKAGLLGSWDRGSLEQTLINVVGNAFKYGAGAPVEVELDADEAFVTARIRDHGVGVAPDQEELIFQRFGRAPQTRGFGGLGLGLWIARQFLEAMGGTIRLKPTAGPGATFEIALPREVVPATTTR